MDPTSSAGSVRKHEDPDDSKNEKRDVKPVVVKTLNRVPSMFLFLSFLCAIDSNAFS